MARRRAPSLALRRPDVMGGQSCFRGTRIPVEMIGKISAKCSVQQIVEDYPSLTPKMVEEAVRKFKARRGRKNKNAFQRKVEIMKQVVRNLELTDMDRRTIKPCPSCGSRNLELLNVSRAYYKITCLDCEAEGYDVMMCGRSFGNSKTTDKLSYHDHWKGKRSALFVWNRRR